MLYTLKKFRQAIKAQPKNQLLSNPYKYYMQWRRSLRNGANSISDELPWITFNAIDFIQQYLTKNAHVFEYGGGGSTLFFLRNGTKVTTVEHDKMWFEKLKNIVSEKSYSNWQGNFIPAQNGNLIEDPDSANPTHYSTADKNNLGNHFKAYASAIDAYPDEYFNVVLVDGRSRPACLIHSLPKIKRNGLLVLDNSDRSYYLTQTKQEIEKKFSLVVSKFGPSPYSYDFTHTTIWMKNK